MFKNFHAIFDQYINSYFLFLGEFFTFFDTHEIFYKNQREVVKNIRHSLLEISDHFEIFLKYFSKKSFDSKAKVTFTKIFQDL